MLKIKKLKLGQPPKKYPTSNLHFVFFKGAPFFFLGHCHWGRLLPCEEILCPKWFSPQGSPLFLCALGISSSYGGGAQFHWATARACATGEFSAGSCIKESCCEVWPPVAFRLFLGSADFWGCYMDQVFRTPKPTDFIFWTLLVSAYSQGTRFFVHPFPDLLPFPAVGRSFQ